MKIDPTKGLEDSGNRIIKLSQYKLRQKNREKKILEEENYKIYLKIKNAKKS